jgi:hypothetical protein
LRDVPARIHPPAGEARVRRRQTAGVTAWSRRKCSMKVLVPRYGCRTRSRA